MESNLHSFAFHNANASTRWRYKWIWWKSSCHWHVQCLVWSCSFALGFKFVLAVVVLPRWVWEPSYLFLWFLDVASQADCYRCMAFDALSPFLSGVNVFRCWICLFGPLTWFTRKNLRDLVDLLSTQDEKNYARAFWRWLDKQKWRKMLPPAVEQLILQNSEEVCVDWVLAGYSNWLAQGPSPFGRLHPWSLSAYVVLASTPSERCEAWFVVEGSMWLIQPLSLKTGWPQCHSEDLSYLSLQLWTLQREIGWSWWCDLLTLLNVWMKFFIWCVSLRLISIHKAIQEYWESMKNTEWFQYHPVLNHPASCQWWCLSFSFSWWFWMEYAHTAFLDLLDPRMQTWTGSSHWRYTEMRPIPTAADHSVYWQSIPSQCTERYLTRSSWYIVWTTQLLIRTRLLHWNAMWRTAWRSYKQGPSVVLIHGTDRSLPSIETCLTMDRFVVDGSLSFRWWKEMRSGTKGHLELQSHGWVAAHACTVRPLRTMTKGWFTQALARMQRTGQHWRATLILFRTLFNATRGRRFLDSISVWLCTTGFMSRTFVLCLSAVVRRWSLFTWACYHDCFAVISCDDCDVFHLGFRFLCVSVSLGCISYHILLSPLALVLLIPNCKGPPSCLPTSVKRLGSVPWSDLVLDLALC